jgi:peptide-methionine (R)-S-oxide reductase
MIQKQDGSVSRRAFLIAGGGAVTAIALNLRYGTKPVQAKSGSPKAVNIVEFSNSGQREDTASLPVIIKTDAE